MSRIGSPWLAVQDFDIRACRVYPLIVSKLFMAQVLEHELQKSKKSCMTMCARVIGRALCLQRTSLDPFTCEDTTPKPIH